MVPRDADARAICHTEEGMEQTIGGGDGGCIEGKIITVGLWLCREVPIHEVDVQLIVLWGR